jgi:adenine-specific DNA-methyltransferase
LDFKDAHNQNIKITGYPTEKNPDLLALIIRASSNEGDIVLDCFSGSGTALDVAAQLQRRWIGIDNSPEAISTTLGRFAKGTEPMGDFVSVRKSRKKAEQQNLRLFGIKDFALYATEPYKGELDRIVAQWRELAE